MSTKEKPGIALRIIAYPFGLALGAGIIALDAFVFAKLWRWFIVPLGPAPLPFWNSCGLSVLLGTIVFSGSAAAHRETVEEDWAKDRRSSSALRALKWTAYVAAMSLAFGWAIQAWVKP